MLTRRTLRIGALAIVAAVVAAGVLQLWLRPRVLHAGHVVTLVDARHPPIGPRAGAGVGTFGTLGLVAGRCVALLGDGARPRIVVWAPGTTVAGTGRAVRLTWRHRTVHLGEPVEGSSLVGVDVASLRSRLPAACRAYPLDDFSFDG